MSSKDQSCDIRIVVENDNKTGETIETKVNEDENSSAFIYIKEIVLIILFNLACLGFIFCVFELYKSDEYKQSQASKILLGIIGIVIVVLIGRAGDISEGKYNFYYI